jgi:aspartate/methionine/tyrosine aminotransferase
MLEEYSQRRQQVVAALAAADGVSLVTPAGAFYAFPRIERLGASPAQALAEGAGVMTVPGEAFGSRGASHVRISFAASPDVLERGLERLRAFLGGGEPS